MHLPDPTFPPLFTGHSVKSPIMPFQHACEGAETGQFSAGDFIWATRTDRLDVALVLEPEVSGPELYEMLFTALVAFGDAFGAIAPPEVALTYAWPQTIRVNGATVGHARTRWSARQDEHGSPLWLVVGLDCWIRRPNIGNDPGLNNAETDLYEEGCAEINRSDLLSSFSRHFLTWIHTWETEGFSGVHSNYLGRTEGHKEEAALPRLGETVEGMFLGLDEAGNALIKQSSDGQMASILVGEALMPEPVLMAEGA